MRSPHSRRLVVLTGLAVLVALAAALAGCGSHVTDRDKTLLDVTVRDNNTNVVIADVIVECGGQLEYTNKNGHARLKSVPIGDQTIKAHKDGYVAATKDIVVTWPLTSTTMHLAPNP